MLISPPCTVTTSLIFLSLLVNTLATILPASSDSDLTEELFKQNTQSEVPGLAPALEESKVQHLDYLLHRMAANILKGNALAERSGSQTGLQVTNGQVARKRVFCNNFTGCGGRFRGRRRQIGQAGVGKRLVMKRPFCNSIGCYNGKKRFVLALRPRPRTLPRVSFGSFPRVSKGPFQQVPSEPSPRVSNGEVKRLFCNGFTGCRNMGKRVMANLESPIEESRRDVDDVNINDEQDREPSKLKRFFNGGFDENMDDILANLRRKGVIKTTSTQLYIM